jgi:hypothetical protein
VEDFVKQSWETIPTVCNSPGGNVSMADTLEKRDDKEPGYSAWLDLPLSTREPMSAKDAKAARKALQALDTRTTVQRMLGEPPLWRSALAQKARDKESVAEVMGGRRFV